MNSEERLEILRMLAAGKISLEEAEMLFDALGDTGEQRSKDQRADQNKRSDSLFGDFGDVFGDFDPSNAFDKNFADFKVIFGGFHDIFGGSAKPRNHQSPP